MAQKQLPKEAQDLLKNLEEMSDKLLADARKLSTYVGRDIVEDLNAKIAGVGFELQFVKGKLAQDLERIKKSVKG